MDWLPTEAAILVAAGIVLVVFVVIGWDARSDKNARDTAGMESPEKRPEPAKDDDQEPEEGSSERGVSVEEESEQSFPASDPPPY